MQIEVLVVGKGCEAAAKQAATVDGVSKVLHVEDDLVAHGEAENITKLLLEIQNTRSEYNCISLVLR